jgi:dihydrofolate reductase
MRRLVLAMFTSVDGFVAGPHGEFSGPDWSADLEKHWSGHALERAGHLLYGRVSFLFNKALWEPAATDPNSPAAGFPHAATMNSLPKTVFSTTLEGELGWNATLARGNLSELVRYLKRAGSGERDLVSFGGASFARSLIARDLVDEYRLMVTPNLFGDGQRIFEPPFDGRNLKLLESRALDTGAVILHYERRRS